MSDAELLRALGDLAEKFERETQIFLWHRNQFRAAVMREAIQRLSAVVGPTGGEMT